MIQYATPDEVLLINSDKCSRNVDILRMDLNIEITSKRIIFVKKKYVLDALICNYFMLICKK